MTSARIESAATLVIVAALSLPAMWGGVSLLRLALARDADAYRALVGDPIVGVAASLELAVAEAGAAPSARVRDLEMLLARAPLNAGAWLDLAIARRAAGEDFGRVVEALSLSSRTGPREARLMKGRVAFALPFWAELPEELKGRLTKDLIGVASHLQPQERDLMAALVRLQAPQDVRSICLALSKQSASDAAYGC